MKKLLIWNLVGLVCIYWIISFTIYPIDWIFSKIFLPATFHDDFGLFASYFFSAIPASCVAIIAGSIAAYMLKGNNRLYWVIALSVIYFMRRLMTQHLPETPGLLPYLGFIVRCFMPAVACFCSGLLFLIIYKKKKSYPTKSLYQTPLRSGG
jgi:hypothetical protein